MLTVDRIRSEETYDWILNRHYAKRVPNITDAFGLYDGKELIGVITYGIPPSPSLCRGICGDDHSHLVLELNRVCLLRNNKNEASFFVAKTLKMVRSPRIVVSYADTSMNHVGTIYQACNFIYTGISAKRNEWREIGTNKHSKTLCEQVSLEERIRETDKYEHIARPQKHRYIYLLGSKKEKKTFKKALNYPIEEYPSGTSKRYQTDDHVIKTQLRLF